MKLFATYVAILFVLFPTSLLSQVAPASDQLALTLAAQSLTAMTGGTKVNDITLSGNATWILGSDQKSGAAILKSRSLTDSRLEFAFADGRITEVRNSVSGLPTAAWLGADGIMHDVPLHNLWSGGGWFFPALSILGSQNSVLNYVGREMRDGIAVQHLRAFSYLPQKNAPQTDLIQKLSTTDFYLDASSLLPTAVAFNTHPDNDLNTNIPVEIRFANYQSVSGIRIPFRIQKLLNGGLHLDVTVSSATVNAGLPDSDFQLP